MIDARPDSSDLPDLPDLPGRADLSGCDAAGLLAAEEAGVRERRRVEVEGMRRLLAWCDLHSVDPRSQPDAPRAGRGGDRLTRVGGEGTPDVSELCFAEFAIAGHTGAIATSNRAAAALDLRHRLPLLWQRVQALEVEAWVARKIADLSRRLTLDAVGLVDACVAAACDLPPGKLIELAEARIIEADPAAHRQRIAAEQARVGVFPHRRRPGHTVAVVDGEADVRGITLRLPTAGSVEFATTIDEIAHALATADHGEHADHGDHAEHGEHGEDVPTMDQLRARAAELLAHPHAAVAFLDGLHPDPHPDPHPGPHAGPQPEPQPEPQSTDTSEASEAEVSEAEVSEVESEPAPRTQHTGRTRRTRRTAVVYVHLSAAVLTGLTPARDGVARVEGLGPMLLDQLTALLRHRHVELHPVIDLNHRAAVDAYEHPATVKERTWLRTGGDVFPHSTARTRRVDHDHVTPYDPGGPPGQTGDHNDAPLTRRHHRTKTHLPYRTRQLGLGAYRWETPHGLVRVVTGYGTTTVQPIRDDTGTLIGEIYPARHDIDLDEAAFAR